MTCSIVAKLNKSCEIRHRQDKKPFFPCFPLIHTISPTVLFRHRKDISRCCGDVSCRSCSNRSVPASKSFAFGIRYGFLPKRYWFPVVINIVSRCIDIDYGCRLISIPACNAWFREVTSRQRLRNDMFRSRGQQKIKAGKRK